MNFLRPYFSLDLFGLTHPVKMKKKASNVWTYMTIDVT